MPRANIETVELRDKTKNERTSWEQNPGPLVCETSGETIHQGWLYGIGEVIGLYNQDGRPLDDDTISFTDLHCQTEDRVPSGTCYRFSRRIQLVRTGLSAVECVDTKWDAGLMRCGDAKCGDAKWLYSCPPLRYRSK